VGDKSVRSLDD